MGCGKGGLLLRTGFGHPASIVSPASAATPVPRWPGTECPQLHPGGMCLGSASGGRGWHSAGTRRFSQAGCCGSESMRPTLWGARSGCAEAGPIRPGAQWERRGGSERGRAPTPSQETPQTNGEAARSEPPGTRLGSPRTQNRLARGPGLCGGQAGQAFPVTSQTVTTEGCGATWSPPSSAQRKAARDSMPVSGVPGSNAIIYQSSFRQLRLPRGHGVGVGHRLTADCRRWGLTTGPLQPPCPLPWGTS